MDQKLHEAGETDPCSSENLGNGNGQSSGISPQIGNVHGLKAALVGVDSWTMETIVEQRESFAAESNLVNAMEVSKKLIKIDGRIGKYLKGADIDRESFTRVFTLAALGVPFAECETLVGMLKGHLLNWPRVKNVARVDGDDGDAELKKLLWVENDCSTPESLIDSVRSAVFVDDSTICSTAVSQKSVRKRKFPNLAKLVGGSSKGAYRLSHSLWKDNLQEGNLVRGSSRKAWEEGAVSVEIVEDSGAENDGDFSTRN